MKKLFLLILLFYFLALFQTSFLIHFGKIGQYLNLILIFIILFNFFEKPGESFGFWAAFFGGFFLDIFSSPLLANFFGSYLFIFLFLAILIKIILRRYLRIPSGQ